MSNNYVLAWHDSEKNTGGSKAKQDTVYFLTQDGVKAIDTPYNNWGKVYASLTAKYRLSSLNGNLLIQYPSGKPLLRRLWLNAAKHNKSLKTFLLIHDLEVLRFHNDADHEKERKEEIQFLDQADGLIALNDKMKGLLTQEGVQAPIVSLKIWDYHNVQDFNTDYKYRSSICYAGNLTKSEFLTKLKIENQLHVFGPNCDKKLPVNVIYEGEYTPTELPAHLNYNFGLIWDGVSVDTCAGNYGQYLRYNDPHKASLYLSSGLPIIVWEKAAIADFVVNNGVGKTISRLGDLDNLLASISQDEFAIMKKNAINVGKKIRQGYYIKDAFQHLTQI